MSIGNFGLGRKPLPPTPCHLVSIRTPFRRCAGVPVEIRIRAATYESDSVVQTMNRSLRDGVLAVFGRVRALRRLSPKSFPVCHLPFRHVTSALCRIRFRGDVRGEPVLVGSAGPEHGQHDHRELPGDGHLRLALRDLTAARAYPHAVALDGGVGRRRSETCRVVFKTGLV